MTVSPQTQAIMAFQAQTATGKLKAVITPTKDGFDVALGRPQRAVAPGQSVVVYRGDELLGGGRIVRAL